ncbi:MAG: S53 family peptidase [Acidobacteriota bacterium]
MSQRLSVAELANLYGFPEKVDGKGETIGIIALGGGYYPEDVELLFRSLGQPAPKIVDVSVPGHQSRGTNRPVSREILQQLVKALAEGSAPPPDAIATLETSMDVQIAAAFAPGADLVVYFAPSADAEGFLYTLLTAIHDSTHRPSVISLSWGWPEPEEMADGQAKAGVIQAVDELFALASQKGMTLCASSGDTGSGVGLPAADEATAIDWVQFPASSPYALACGGTSLDGAGLEEVVWSVDVGGTLYASTGGASKLFDRPEWQQRIVCSTLPGLGRGVPDVAGLADQRSGVTFYLGGAEQGSAGTSAAAPLWAALIARLNEALGRRLGHVNPRLYRIAKDDPSIFRDVVAGSNGGFRASLGWDPVTGWGSPHGEKLLAALAADLEAFP